ncbi:MAG: hypothetical protein REI11_09050 [Patulibacter sp.]|nr:hypothetical protein [Patulibacter sp.]
MSPAVPVRRPARTSIVLSLALAVLAVLMASGQARAASPITGFYAGPVATGSTCAADGTGVTPSTAADTYTDFCLAYSTVTSPATPIAADDLKREVIDTPVGFAANAGSFPHCTADQFAADDDVNDNCPADAQVGAATAKIRTQVTAASGSNLALTVPPVPGNVYNLTPGPGEVARLGIVLKPFVIKTQPYVKVVVGITLRPAPNVGLRSIIDNLPTQVKINPPNGDPQQTQPVAVDTFALTFWGPTGHTGQGTKPFVYLGSDCTTDQATHISGTSYDGTPTSADATPYRLTGCDDAAIPFSPSSTVTTTENRPDETTAATVHVRFAQSTDPTRVASTVKSTTLTLPGGLAFSGQIASGAAGLPLCTAAAFAQTSAAAATCPAGSSVGDVSIASPAIADPLTGHAYLGAQPAAGALPDLYIEAALGTGDDAPRVKLVGHLAIDDQNRIVATLSDLPQLPVSDLALTFRGGDNSALVTPEQCGTTTGSLQAVSWAQPSATNTTTNSYSVTDDCGPRPFSPSVAFNLDDPNSAGKSSPLTTTIVRPDRSPRLTHVEIDLPQGQLATLKGVPTCGASDAAAGTCPESTRVGTMTGVAGIGPAPYHAPGAVYLSDPVDGNVAGLVLEVPIKFGDVDLGQLTVQAQVLIRSSDIGLRVIADVPLRFKGIPLNLQALQIRLDRTGFALSPTSCGALYTTSHMTDDAGATVPVPSAPFQVTGCDSLPFAPQLDAAVTGNTANKGRPNVSVRITSAAGSVALRQTFVVLPKGLGVDLAQIPRACSVDAFQASACPATSAIGKASGTLSITNDPLAGNVYLLKVPGQTLPGIGLAFQGRYHGNVQGVTAVDTKTSQLRTNFTTIPDLPLTSLQIDITGGTNGLLIATDALCDTPTMAFQSTFVSQAKPSVQRTSYSYCGAGLGASVPRLGSSLSGVSKGKPTLALTVTAPSATGTQLKLKSFDVTLPSGYAIDAKRAKSSKGVSVKKLTVKGKATTKRISSTKLRVTLPSAGTTVAKLLTRTGTVSIKSAAKRKSKKAVTVKVAVTYTNGQKATIPVRLTP